MMKQLIKLLSVAVLAFTFIASPAWAISKDEAKAQGLIGERANGYLGLVSKNAPSGVQALINEINHKRRIAYEKGAQNAGVERGIFEVRMGQRLQQRAPNGHFIQLPNGNWKKK